MPFKTKICGVTNREDAKSVSTSGVDAIGLNFFAGSKRFVDLQTARDIAESIPATVFKVGVFVNASSDEIHDAVVQARLNFVQLHGDEPPEFLSELNDLPIIRAFRCNAGLAPVAKYLDQCQMAPVAVLIDAYDPNEYGGTGKSLHWPDLADARRFIGELPLILAGGLTPDNVARAIREARPFGVDTASGVELANAPRRKSEVLSKSFVTNANAAFTDVSKTQR